MKKVNKEEMKKKFRNEIIERKKMNYLTGGDGDGGQGAVDDPWK